MQLHFGYGSREQIVNVPDEQLCGVLTANEMAHARTGPEAVAYALENPIGAPVLRTLVHPGQKIAIVASDISRPVPSYEILPVIPAVPRQLCPVFPPLRPFRQTTV